MTSAAPWSVKGIDPKAREIAKDLARRSGMTLGEWLTSVIYDDDAETPAGAPSRRAGARPASENRPPRRSDDDLSRVLGALEELSARFEASVQEQAAVAARFDRAIGELKADQAKVAERLHSVEQGGPAAAGKAETLRALETALNKVATHLGAGESRQREAMAAMRRELGDEMARVAEQVNRKVLEVENRSADAIAQVGAEVTRVAAAVEQRLRRADDLQAESLEKLGGEIARITERLSERIAAAERRAAEAVEDVGQQVARVTDRVHQRQDRHESELVERMRQSEERTARLLEEARQTIDRRLGRLGEAAAEGASAGGGFQARWARPEPPEEPEPAFLEPPALIVEAEAVEEEEGAPSGEAPVRGLGLEAHAPTLTADPNFAAPDEAAALEAVAQAIAAEGESFEEVLEAEEIEAAEAAPAAEAEAEPEAPRASARELIEQAKAAAFAEQDDAFRPAAEADAPDQPQVFLDLSSRRPRPTSGGAMRGVLLAGGAAASIGLAATGYVYLHPEITGGAPAKPIPVGPPSAAAGQPGQAPVSQAAVALAAAPTPRADGVDLAALFREASTKVEAGDPAGVEPLRTAANLGYAPAQRRLGKLYEDGGAGVQKDPVEGRRWTQRAAANGDARGMHNLGLDYYEGSGGIKNAAVAAEWFRRAAQLGLRDSQYNLARFYETGVGVQRDLPAAYRWYLIAARGGDTEAGSRAEALKAKLTAPERAQAEALAGAFRPDPAPPPSALTASLRATNPRQVALAERALAKLGYYKGPADGAANDALGEAIQAYQRDRGLAENGQLSPELVQSFAHVLE